MASTNQKHVAEALYLARTQNFFVGREYLVNNVKGNPSEQHTWFLAKCLEHGIVTPNDVYMAYKSIGEGFDKVKEALQGLGVSAVKAFNALNHIIESNREKE